jgi:hypothetical protein
MHRIGKKNLRTFLSYPVHHTKSIPSVITSQTSPIVKPKALGLDQQQVKALSPHKHWGTRWTVLVKNKTKKEDKVTLIGDSHGRGCASELKQTLDKVGGYVKPGASVSVLVNTVKEEVNRLRKKHIVIFWGRTNLFS